MHRMKSELADLFDRYTHGMPVSGKDLDSDWRWGLEVDDKDDSVVIRAEAPGFEADDFDIQVSDNRLILRAVRKTESSDKASEYRERCECYESMPLPSGTDKDKIEARYHSGVLTLTIPKTAEGKPKRIAVTAN